MKAMRQWLKGTISLSRTPEFYVSTISDNPESVFENIAIFERENMHGIHFDVMDGHFVPRLGLYPELLKAIRKTTKLPIEVHVMASESEKILADFADAGADRILVHSESTPHSHRILTTIKKMGMGAGIVLNPGTPLDSIDFLVDELDVVMLMAINPGIPKHPIIPSTFRKLGKLRKKLDKLKPETLIGLDGGVTFENACTLIEAGADWLVCGSGTVFAPEGTVLENIDRLRRETKHFAS